MPRKTKDSKINEKTNELKNVKKAVSSTKKTTTKKSTSKAKKVTTSKVTKANAEKKVSKSKKASAKKENAKTADIKKETTKKAATAKIKKETTKTATVKKGTTKKATTSKKTSKTRKKSSVKAKVDIVEYYDLPYRYNQTVVKVLAQTPTNLFIYWDISDADRENYIKEYGENFFEITKPVLIIYNDTLNYSFEVEINDFANSWYLHVNDSKCNYRVELGRRLKTFNSNSSIKDYVYISSSNVIESPNNRILFNKEQQMVYFKNVKTNSITSKSMANISFIRNMGKIYNIYDLYKKIYKDEDMSDLSNPSSPINF